MNKIQISEEYFERYKDNIDFDKSEFNTEQKIEVRVPFTGYYSLTIPCRNPQIAMTEVLKVNRDIGIMDLEGSSIEIEDINEEETYAIILKKQ